MNLISYQFLAFLTGVLFIYYLVPHKIRWVILLVASYGFYALYAGWRLLVYILFTTLTIYFAGLLLNQINEKQKSTKVKRANQWQPEEKRAFEKRCEVERRWIVAVTLFLNFGVLAFFKYYNAVAASINDFAAVVGGSLSLPTMDLLLPLGISFYTFQSVGYLIDVKRGRYTANKNLGKFALFVSFFPQLIQGPISRYDQLAPQLFEPHVLRYNSIRDGFGLILWGCFKKLVIADRAAVIVAEIFGSYTEYLGVYVLFAGLLYGIQIYCDFSGGIDVVRGVAEMLGIHLEENFERPFFARSLSEFWRRWHITLGAWMRNYLFYSLALSTPFVRIGRWTKKKFGIHFSKSSTACILSVIVFIIVGMWHGAGLEYIAYGLYNGLIIGFSQLLTPAFEKTTVALKIRTECFSWKLFQMLRTLFIVTVGRILVHAVYLKAGIAMLRSMFTTWNPWVLFDGSMFKLGLDNKDFILLVVCIVILLLVSCAQEKGFKFRAFINDQNIVFRYIFYLAAVGAIVVFGYYSLETDPTAFIYGGF